ncbi:hypothetical protein BT96DRAFT_1008617 [Gymnopus androsaceus JB14]|uniref:Uncharacterized protein n=1 Tax=Gymnopus androsaceus JB14 TaxID=1447944 RepID=A0A6A4GEG9_9AGAR|nr:hypothetical protein BT96DRAFT_1008617 [Gymnopus androsaceus JB14]
MTVVCIHRRHHHCLALSPFFLVQEIQDLSLLLAGTGPITGPVLSGVGLNTVQPERVVDPLESDDAPISPIGIGSGDGAAVDPCPDDGLHLDSASSVPQMVPDDDEEVGSGDGLGEVYGLGEVFGPSKLDESIPVSSLPSGTPERLSALSLLSTDAFPSPGTASGLNSALLDQSDSAGAGAPHHMKPLDDDEEVGSGDGLGEVYGLGEVFGPSKLDESIPVSSLPSGTPKRLSALSLLSTDAFPSPGTASGLNSALLDQSDSAAIHHTNSSSSYETLGFVDHGPVFDPSKLAEPVSASSSPFGTPETISSLSNRSVSGLNSAPDDPHRLRGGVEAMDPSSSEGVGSWNVMQAISGTGDEAIYRMNSDASSSYPPPVHIDPGPDSVGTEEPPRAISETPASSAHRLAFGLVSDNHRNISEPIPEQSPTPTVGSPGPDFDDASGSLPRVIRSSQRIKAKRPSDSEGPSPKRPKLSQGKKRTAKTTERDVVNNNDDMDIGEDCEQVPRLEVHGDKEREPSPAIHVYSADHTKYYEYEGKHYSSQIAKDLQKLAAHVDVVRSKNGLPTGRPIEWADGMTSPVNLLTPAKLLNSSPIYTLDFADFLKTSAKDLQDIFRHYPAIVVSGRPTRLKCDLTSLEEWGGVDELRDMHGKLSH